MPCLARTIIIYGRKNRFRKISFQDEKRAQSAYEKMRRKGLDVQLAY